MNLLLDNARFHPGHHTGASVCYIDEVARKRVLVADDDLTVRESLTDVLESEGYLVDEACNGIEAVTRTIKHTPDLILLDLNMPHWDGWTAFGKLDKVAPLLPIIVITARPHQYETAVRLGVDAFMEKPLDIPVLLKAMSALIEEEPAARIERITNRKFVTRWLRAPAKGSQP